MTQVPKGTVLGGYRVTDLIAVGGMGSVHLAESVETGQPVAVKVLLTEHAGDDAFRHRFLREADYARAIDHPGVVRVLDAGVEGDYLYIAMEHVEGEDLGAILAREGSLAPGRALALLGQVAAGLDAAHAAGIVHRDVKPGNVIVTPGEERALLVDFGLGKRPSQDSGSLTAPGDYVGSFLYTAPEQILGKDVDGRTDVYSLTCVLFECVAGEPPFTAERSTEVLSAHLDAPPPRVEDSRPGLPRELGDALVRGLAKEPGARFGACSQLIAVSATAVRAAALAPVAGGSDPPSLRLRVSAGNATGTAIEVEDELEIGREAEGVGRLAEDAEISRRHARFARSGSGYTVEDLGSTNGTFLNGRRIDQPELLGVGDEVQVGGTTLIVQVSAPTSVEEAAPEPAAPVGAEPAEAEPLEEAGPPPAVVESLEEPAEQADAEPAEAGSGGTEQKPIPSLPRLAFRVELDFEAGEARVELDEGSDSVRFVFEDGAWRIKPAE